MSKFKVGDKVVIRNDLQNYKNFGTLSVTQAMRDMHGKTSTITEVLIDGDTVYQLDRYRISGSPWFWCNDCFSSSKASYPVTAITTDGTTTTATLREGKRVIRTASAKCGPRDTFDYETGAKLAFNRLFTEVTEAAKDGFDKMTTDELTSKCCRMGSCSKNPNRKNDCPFKHISTPNGCYKYAETHPEIRQMLIDYLRNEAISEAVPEPPKPKYYTGKVVCVKSGYPWWTVGKVYNIVNGTITADDGYECRGYISAEDARHAGNALWGNPFPGSDAGHNPDNEFIPFVEG